MSWRNSRRYASPPPSPNSNQTSSRRHSSTFYYADGNLIFLVEKTLFKLHKFILERESPVLRDMFLDVECKWRAEGHSDDNPIKLDGVRVQAFEAFVKILYQPFYRKFTAADAEWVNILELSTKWKCEDIRNLAIKEIDGHIISPINKIKLAQKLKIQEWLVPCYVQLCERPTALTLNEAQEVGLEVTLIVGTARERARSYPQDKPKLRVTGADLVAMVKEVAEANSL